MIRQRVKIVYLRFVADELRDASVAASMIKGKSTTGDYCLYYTYGNAATQNFYFNKSKFHLDISFRKKVIF